jgi:hypothetical protein
MEKASFKGMIIPKTQSLNTIPFSQLVLCSKLIVGSPFT